MPLVTAAAWQAFLERHPGAHLLQTAEWGSLKSEFGWQAARLVSAGGDWGAQVLFRSLPLGLSVAYLPRGPVGLPALTPSALAELDELCRQRRAIFLKVEPDGWDAPSEPAVTAPPASGPAAAAPPPGFVRSAHAIQPPRTLVVDLSGSEEALLGRMKQKTRYNVRLALKRGVVVGESQDLDAFYALMQVTGERDRFGVHSLEYYRRAYELFAQTGQCVLLLAEVQHTPAAALMAFARGRRAWYFYGASAGAFREDMPTYLLQWQAMRWAQALGCQEYDLWGVPDAELEALEAGFAARSDGLWGVYRFKRGFGGALRRSPGPWDRVYSPLLYRLYTAWINRRAGAGA